jgi:aminocarboxymuconate-semialdehyde decarboxylase
MAEQGIDVQINGGWLDSFGYVLPPYKGHAWSRFLKEHLIAASNEKDNLRALGSVTLQDGEKAALLLEGLVGEGLAGVMIGTQLHGDHSNLDDPALNPFWAVASDHKAVVFIHPMYGCNDIRLNDYDIIKAVGQGLDLDNTTALVSMFYAGHLLDTPACPWFCRIMPVAGLGWLDGYTTNTIIYLDQYADPVEGFSRIYFLCRRIRSGRSQFSDGQGGCG